MANAQYPVYNYRYYRPAKYTLPAFAPAERFHGPPKYDWIFGIKKFWNSFTSYQFPNPYPPNQDPLSRLEFPIDQWFATAGVKYIAPHWAIMVKASHNISRHSDMKMQDSDWEDDTRPFQKTIFSESDCTLDKGLLLDTKVLFDPPIFRTSVIKGVIGYRFQEFHFTTHDGTQLTLNGFVTPIDGDGIEFTQKFLHVYFGGQFDYRINRIFRRNIPSPIYGTILADYAIVDALNEDLHLLRMGERITREDTIGHCWRIGLIGAMNISQRLKVEMEADFKRIITHGDHKLMNAPLGVYFSFDGSEVWSDQFQISANGVFTF